MNNLKVFFYIVFLFLLISCSFPNDYYLNSFKYPIPQNTVFNQNLNTLCGIYIHMEIQNKSWNDTTKDTSYSFFRIFPNGRLLWNSYVYHKKITQLELNIFSSNFNLLEVWEKEKTYYAYLQDSVIAVEKYLGGMQGYAYFYARISADTLHFFKAVSRQKQFGFGLGALTNLFRDKSPEARLDYEGEKINKIYIRENIVLDSINVDW